jgi:hypothetical protein
VKLLSIKNNSCLLMTHSTDGEIAVGHNLILWELPQHTEGVVVQVIGLETMEYAGLTEELIQELLTDNLAQTIIDHNAEQGMGALKELKIVRARVLRRVRDGKWEKWDGWVPARHVEMERISSQSLIQQIFTVQPHCPIRSFARYQGLPLVFDGRNLGLVNVVVGIKGAGKSHTGKHLVLSIAEKQVPVLIFDANGEYTALPGAQVLRWSDNFALRLSEVGWGVLMSVVQTIAPLTSGSPSESTFQGMLPAAFRDRRDHCRRKGMPFSIDMDYLCDLNWGSNQYVADAIKDRLERIRDMHLFDTEIRAEPQHLLLADIYEQACAGQPLVFDLRELSYGLRNSLVKATIKILETICNREYDQGSGRFPICFFDEASLYISETAILDLITRTRHLGIASVFLTNDPQRLPAQIYRQLDNLILLALNDRMDCRVLSNAYIDQEMLEAIVSRLPARHALIVGDLTAQYPMVCAIDALPTDIAPTGATRSAWDRFEVPTQRL